MANMEALLEAERRGILSPEKAAVLSEARKRRLVDEPAVSAEATTAPVTEVTSGENFVPERAADMKDYLLNRAKYAVTGSGLYDFGALLMSPFISNETLAEGRRLEEQRRRALGVNTGLKPPEGVSTLPALLAGGAVEGVADPLTYVGGGLIRQGVRETARQAAARATLGGAGGAGGELGGAAGGLIGQEVDRIMASGEQGGGTTAEAIGRLIGGGAGGVAGGLVAAKGAIIRDIGKSAYSRASNAALNIKDPVKAKAIFDAQAKEIANKEIKEIVSAAARSDSNMAAALLKAEQWQRTLGTSVPTNVAVANNPVVLREIRSLAEKNPEFRAQYLERFEEARRVLQAKADDLFGDATGYSGTKTEVKSTAIAKSVDRRLKSLDDSIARVSQRVTPKTDSNVLGEQIESLIDQKRVEAMKSVQPLYQEAFDVAKAKGVQLPGATVGDIYNRVVNETSTNVFQSYPELYRKIKDTFQPTEQGGFAPAGIDAIDSLKREINASLRKARNDTDVRVLRDLKDTFDASLNTLDPEFVSKYRMADDVYRQKVGIPFSEETLVAMGRSKFVENLVPLITRDKSHLSEFLTATGEAGQQRARDAFLIDLEKSAMTDGVLDAKKARKWLDKNKTALSMLPGLADEVTNAAGAVSAIDASKRRLNAQFTDARKTEIARLEDKTPTQILADMYRDPNTVDKYMKTYGNDRDSLRALRSFALDDLLKSGDAVSMLASKERSSAYAKLFGPTYLERVKTLGEIADALENNPAQIAFDTKSIPTTWAEKVSGIPLPQMLSVLRDRISSPIHKFAILASKSYAAKQSLAYDEEMKALLLDPEALRTFEVEARKIASGQPVDAKKWLEMGRKYGLTPIKRGALSGTQRGADEPSTEDEEVVLPE